MVNVVFIDAFKTLDMMYRTVAEKMLEQTQGGRQIRLDHDNRLCPLSSDLDLYPFLTVSASSLQEYP